MAPPHTPPKEGAGAKPIQEDGDVRLIFSKDDVEEGFRDSGPGTEGEMNDEGRKEHPATVAPLRLPDNGEIDEVASRMLQNISNDEAATKLGRRSAEDGGEGVASGGGAGGGGGEGSGARRRDDNPESVEVPPGPTGFTVEDEEETGGGGGEREDAEEVDQYADPVADKMMAKIFRSASTTQLGRKSSGRWGSGEFDATSYETQNYGPGYEDTLSPKDRKLLENEMRALRETRMAEMMAEASAPDRDHQDDEHHHPQRRQQQQQQSDGTNPTATATANTHLRTVVEEDPLRLSFSADPAARAFTSTSLDTDTDAAVSNDGDVEGKSTTPWGELRVDAAEGPAPHGKGPGLFRAASRSASSFMGMGNFFEDGESVGKRSPRLSSHSGSLDAFRRDSRADNEAAEQDQPPTPPIRIRRTSSYYVATSKNNGGHVEIDTGDGDGPGAAEKRRARDETMLKRRTELIAFRMRVAGFGKLSVTLLAGCLAGITLWAMTTVTAQLTNVKFDAVRELIRQGNLGSAWALYVFFAAAAIGTIAFAILHPKGCPMARGSGIPELKGYLNGNRQQGLFHWRTFAGRAVGICLVIVATMPFGREGPSVHIGACAASMALNLPWRAYLGWQPSPEERRHILQLGAAAGVAAAFNAPIGGLLYVMEEVASNLPPDYVWRAMITTGMAVGIGQVLYTAMAAQNSRIDYSSLVISDPNSSTGWVMRELPLIVVLATLAGALSAVYTLAGDFFGRLRRGKVENAPECVKKFFASKVGTWLDAVAGAVLVASCQLLLPALFTCRTAPQAGEDYPNSSGGVISGRHLMSGIYVPRKFVGYTCEAGDFSEMATLMLQNEEGVIKHLFARDELYTEKLFTPPVVMCFLAYFFFVSSVTFGGAFPAGVFIPNMVMGATLGRLFGFLAQMVTPEANKGTYALIGSAAMLGGFTRMTAAVTVIVIEATGVLDVLAPIILACVVARATANALIGHNLDERMILSKGVPFLEHEAHPSSAATKIGDVLREADTRRGPIIAFRPQERLQVLLNALILTEHNAFPVLEDVEENTGLRGLVTRAMLQRVLRIVLENTEQNDEREQRRSSSGNATAAVKRRDSKGKGVIVIDDWSVEGLDSSATPRPIMHSASSTAEDDTPSDGTQRSMSSRTREGEFMSTVAKWMNSNSSEGTGTGTGTGTGGIRESFFGPQSTKKGDHVDSLSARVVSAAERQAAKPATGHADDDHHFDELKEGLVKKIRQGVKHVSNEHLTRMVDLSHALDPAPWTVDANMKLARVHALFHRLGVRHLCVVSNSGRKLEGIITRHDLIHVHRIATEH